MKTATLWLVTLFLGSFRTSHAPSPPTLLLHLTELCYYPNVNVDRLTGDYNRFVFKDVCDDPTRVLQMLRTINVPIIGSLEADICSPAHFLADYFNATLITWNCPQEIEEPPPPSQLAARTTRNLGASIPLIARRFSRLITYMKWKSIAIISTNVGWWPKLSQMFVLHMRESGVVPKHYAMLSENSSVEHIEYKLEPVIRMHVRVIIICAPGNTFGRSILEAIDNMQLSKEFSTLTVLMDISALPSWSLYLNSEQTEQDGSHHSTENITGKNNASAHMNSTHNNSRKRSHDSAEGALERRNTQLLRADFLERLGNVTKKHILLLSDKEPRDAVEDTINKQLKKIGIESFAPKDKEDCFGLLDLKDDYYTMRRLLKVCGQLGEINEFEDNLQEWHLKHQQKEDCELCDASELTKLLSYVAILTMSIFSIFAFLAVVAWVRYHILKKHITKGPYKVLLTATDFVFPQLPDTRRVDEGIEAMLCCWLQQLQEFGGPEVEKPDLLQGSGNAAGGGGGASGGGGGNTRTPLRGGSSPSLAKQLLIDPRVRYNGDLVQMKPIQLESSVELKAKTVEVLVLLHGLRHENLNPLIGCLAEPPRVYLVSEYCARGSLQDVLQQDDIKLDWSFRLSLLTDLVRGMKYLHQTPIKVHGYLTSRNCVIDARWVLKITDYGLPSFYNTQGITVAQKSAKELLWTAPELLRQPSLQKTGTPSGDVYSFGIIMQEVVVRGEPFCMLALTPEEIIAKVKKPPPLIRPSVSKGAAPPEAINIMRQCWAEQAEMRPDFNAVHDQFKKLNHGRKVNIVDTMFQMLEKYSNNLEELIRERTEQLDVEKRKTEQLLNRMLPSSVAEKLKLGMHVDPEEFAEVTIYFSDIVGFTTISAHSTPFQVVDLLNDLYTCFDATINAYNVYKVETIGDAYMVVGGLPTPIHDHAEQIATMALDLLHQSGRFRIRHLPKTPLRLRIGLHTGPCCAGVVGLTMPRYCLFGDTVNTASRMESTGSPWRIHLSTATRARLEKAGGYKLQYRGATEVKGKGTMDTYWLSGKAGFDKPLPTPPSLEENHGLDESDLVSHDIKPMSEGSMDSDTGLHMTAFDDSNSDNPGMSMGTPVSASEVAAALLGASTSSLSGYRQRPRRIEEEDLSTPYSHYKCLSPKDRLGKLRRQFSLDRAPDESRDRCSPKKLCKQNSAGAADLEKIEEVTMTSANLLASDLSPGALHCSLSISASSLLR
ncbi:retinal guanylyl cyclase 2 isoform X3 [Atheta coriaria]|uniref:retinal guanylyl cyclase 2 isoform X3 n=1 Tax=Dalotia coriaria TaxID=877792 RepID=UPI0031F3F2E0